MLLVVVLPEKPLELLTCHLRSSSRLTLLDRNPMLAVCLQHCREFFWGNPANPTFAVRPGRNIRWKVGTRKRMPLLCAKVQSLDTRQTVKAAHGIQQTLDKELHVPRRYVGRLQLQTDVITLPSDSQRHSAKVPFAESFPATLAKEAHMTSTCGDWPWVRPQAGSFAECIEETLVKVPALPSVLSWHSANIAFSTLCILYVIHSMLATAASQPHTKQHTHTESMKVDGTTLLN